AVWQRLGIVADVTVLKHRLADVKARFTAAAYYHVGDSDADAFYASDAGFRFLKADAAAYRAWASELFGASGRASLQLRDDVLVEHLDGRHHLVVRDRFRRHQELQVVHARRLVDGDAPQTVVGI